jgi:2,3-bisphosphoglycerate-independent phosphoglycerate mutase
LSSAVDLVRGLGVLTGIDVVDVPGATAGFDNDYTAQLDACLASLRDRDFFLLHVEATDEAGHAGNLEEKVTALERWDDRILRGLIDGLDAMGPWRLLLLPDHPTPVRLKTHTTDSVPYLLVDSATDGPGGTYTEPATEACSASENPSAKAVLVIWMCCAAASPTW